MSGADGNLISRAWSRQWSFFWAGITFGVAQVVYMIGLWIESVQAGKKAGLTPITVTTDLGNMFRGLEVGFYWLFNLPDFQLYGKAINGVSATGGAFVPGIGWPILGMAIGGWLVARAERESRTWVYYPTRVLVISFIGGMLFSYGTRLAGGCTLNHLLGGIPLLNIHSFVTVAFMALGGALAFMIMSKTGMAPYFKHQETKSYALENDVGERATYREGYVPMRRVIYWVSLAFAIAMLGTALLGGLFNPESLQHLKSGKMIAFAKSVDAKGWFYVVLTLGAGIIGGFGMAKSGFGTECALVAAEAGQMMKRDDQRYAVMGVPRITRTLMRSYLPMIGIIASWLVMLGFIMLSWVFLDVGPKFSGDIKYQTTAGNLIGGMLLGMGAVMLIGCEIRSYMRIGLGYLNTWVGFMGFAVGYLPYTLFLQGHESFLKSTLMVETYHFYQLFSPDSILGQKVVLGLWWFALLGLMVFFVRLGVRTTGAPAESIIHKNTEDLQNEIDMAGHVQAGRYHGVPVPAPVPA